MWASFYHLVFKSDRKQMKFDSISQALQKVCNTFGTSVRCYRRSKTNPYFTPTTHKPK
jgi:hypothetical protein